MASLNDPRVRALLEPANYVVVSTLNSDGSISSSIVWVSLEGDELAVNSAAGRRWPTNLDRDGHVTLMAFAADNPYEYVEIRGRAIGTREDADDHIDRLAKKYINQDKYPYRTPEEERVKYVITPETVRYVNQG
ncbi:MAG: TIGR03618 family F420-dependent PPOX class oxidoreductase [Solirubrobacteraceae bacterium]